MIYKVFTFCNIFRFLSLLICTSVCFVLAGQNIHTTIPKAAELSGIYLFYLHGGVVQAQGANAVSPYYGRYEYQGILDTLSHRGYHVISEVRPKNTDEKIYARKLSMQIDSLLDFGIPAQQIVIVGASLGAYIAMETSILIGNTDIRYVLLGLCSDYALEYFKEDKSKLYGEFLSIYESSDSKSSCQPLFLPSSDHFHFKEIQLKMGIDHAFLFKPYREWIDPLVEWIKQNHN